MARENLTPKQQLFIAHYLINLNATEAAREAGYQGSYGTLQQVGRDNLLKPNIRAIIQSELAKRIPSAEEVLGRIAAHSDGDATDFTVRDDEQETVQLDLYKAHKAGKFKLVKKLTEKTETRRTKDGEEFITKTLSVELYDAAAAHDKLMRYHALYNDKLTVNYSDEIMSLLREGRITRGDVEQELGVDFARELFEMAGVPVG